MIKILNKDDVRPIGAFVQVQEESGQRDGNESLPGPAPQPTEPATPFKPKGAMAEIKREVFIRLQAYQQRTKLGWAQRVSDAAGGNGGSAGLPPSAGEHGNLGTGGR